MKALLVVRHGESTWNAQKRCQGQADPPLSDLGMQSAVDLAPSLLRFGFRSVVTSDLLRARQTAEVLAARLELKPLRLMPDLRERDMGAFTGLTNTEVEIAHPQWIERMRAGLRPDPPGAESRDVLLRRAREGLVRAAKDDDGPAVVVTHGGVLEIVATHLGMKDLRFWNLHGYWLSVADDDSMQYTESFPSMSDQRAEGDRAADVEGR